MHEFNVMVPGHKDTVLTLLQAGARRSTVNNMGKNVIQLGSFVGELWGAVKVTVRVQVKYLRQKTKLFMSAQ